MRRSLQVPVLVFAALVCTRGLAAGSDCDGGAAIGYLCGVAGAEDLVALPGTPWIVTSGLAHGDQPGGLLLIDRAAKSVAELLPRDTFASRPDTRSFPGCPGPFERSRFSAHGLNLRAASDGGPATLYVINHGEREAVEVFELDASSPRPHLTWIGCVPAPAHSSANGVAPLPGGGLAVTLMTAPEYFSEPSDAMRQEAWIPKFEAAEITGHVARWTPGGGWQKLAGTEASVPNGIEASADGRWLWVAHWAERRVVRVPLWAGGPTSELALDFMPDNVRWGDDGQLWVTGATGSPADYFACWAEPGCKNDYALTRIDPRSLTQTRVPHPPTLPVFGEATTALKAGAEVWIAAYPSDRLAYLPFAD